MNHFHGIYVRVGSKQWVLLKHYKTAPCSFMVFTNTLYRVYVVDLLIDWCFQMNSVALRLDVLTSWPYDLLWRSYTCHTNRLKSPMSYHRCWSHLSVCHSWLRKQISYVNENMWLYMIYVVIICLYTLSYCYYLHSKYTIYCCFSR